MKTLPVSVSLVSALLVSLAFAADGFAQTTPAQAAGGASQGAAPAAASGGVGSTIAAIVAVGAAATLSIATSNTTVSSNH